MFVVFALYLIGIVIYFFCRKTFQLALPQHWFQIILFSPHLFSIREVTQGNQIISAITSEKMVPESLVSKTVDDGPNFMNMDKLQLPWSEKFWHLVVTNPKSTVEIWGRLIGAEYSVSTRKSISNTYATTNNNFYYYYIG